MVTLEKEGVMVWLGVFILWWMEMLAIFQCRSIACEWTCTWSWSWEYEKFLTQVMEFYFMGGWQCLLSSSVEVCEWMCTWSWSWEYDKSLTRVKEFDKTQKQSQTAYEGLSMKNLTLDFLGIFINLRRQAIDNFFLKRNPKYFAKKSIVPFIQSYHISQLLR